MATFVRTTKGYPIYTQANRTVGFVGLLQAIVGPAGNTLTFYYDEKVRGFDQENALGHRSVNGNQFQATYYANGFANTVTDGRGTVTTLAYDNYGNPSTAQTGTRPAITYTFDVLGRMTGLTDQVNAATTFIYDKRSLPLGKIDPLLKSTGSTYYDDGKLWTKTDRNGNITTYTYTPSGKPESIVYPGGSPVSLIYNLLDNPVEMWDGIGVTRYTYDAAGRVASTTNPFGSVVSYAYDAAGNLTELTYPGNKKVTYTYDELNRLKTVTNWLSQTATYVYDDAGRLSSLTNFNGTVTTYGYDAANRLTDIDSAVADYHFTLDGNGNRTQIIQTEPLAAILTPGSTTYAYNTQKNRLQTAGTNSFGYDGEGRLSTGYGSSYSFDYEHRLTGFSGATFSYDGGGRRLQAVRSGVTSRYIYGGGNLLAEADGANNITRYYIYGAGLLAMVMPTDEIYCYHYNGTGSTIAMTDQSQAMVNKYAYDPFGKVANQEEAMAQPFKYVGQYGVMAEPNGFFYMRARYYDPNVGRFVSEDPIGFSGGDVNLYAHVWNNPVRYIDPWGLAPGDPYPSQDSAAYQAVIDINATSIRQHREYGGMIYQNPSGTFSYTEPNKGSATSVNPGGPNSVPSGTTATAYYHTHGGNDPGYVNEEFSGPDKNYANSYSIDGYLGTPSGSIQKYNSSSGSVTTLSGNSGNSGK